MNRRNFIVQCAGSGAAASLLGAGSTQIGKPQQGEPSDTIHTLPSFCSHEHWGSINSIGMAPEGFRGDTEAGATPTRPTSVWDLFLDPYLNGYIRSAGGNQDALPKAAGVSNFAAWWMERPSDALSAMRPHLERQVLTGTFQCIRRGVQFLHGIDCASFDIDTWQQADKAIAARYQHIFQWYRSAMDKAHFSELIRPVHPEFYVRKQSEASAREELAFTSTVMRIDPLLGFWSAKSERRDNLAKIAGVEPRDAQSWREFIARLFNLAAREGCLGIKQLQAYSRVLDFPVRADADVVWSGDLTPQQRIVFQDWVVNECCKQAHERQWPHQVHVGTHNLHESSPLPLGSLARRYPNMDIVMLHCWPFIDESGWLAKRYHNVYIDTCWQPVLSPAFFRQAMETWINYVPVHKITCGQDSTSVEMAVGSSLFTREILAETLTTEAKRLGLGSRHITRTAADMLHNNAERIYSTGA